VSVRIRWGYADNEEGPFTGEFETREEAVAEGLSAIEPGDAVWVVAGHEYPGWRYMPSPDRIIDAMNDQADDNNAPEDWDGIDLATGAKQELADLLRAWTEKHIPWAGFWETSGRAECVRKGEP
jgi:hypothetical protein